MVQRSYKQSSCPSQNKKILSTIKVTKPATGESCNDASLVVIIVNGREDVLKNVDNVRGEQNINNVRGEQNVDNVRGEQM